MKVWINDGAFQVWPTEPGERFYGDNVQIVFDDMYWIKAPDHRLIIWHYNTDDLYDHLFTIRMGQHSEEAFIASLMPASSMEAINESIQAVVSAQEDAKEAAAIAAIEYFGQSQLTDEEAESL